MTTWDFPCSDPIDIAIDSWASGSIVLAGEQTDTVVVEVVPSHRSRAADLLDQVEVEFDDGQLVIHGPRAIPSWRRNGLDLTIKAPTGSSCAAKTASADISCVGTLSALSLNTASGDLSASTVTGDVTAKSASGDLLLGQVGGDLTAQTASGDVRANQVDGAVQVNSASGDVALGYCSRSVTTRTAAGDVQIGAVVSGEVELHSVSGDVEVAVVPGIGVYLELSSLSGTVRSDLDEVESAEATGPAGPTVEIRVRTMSGDIHVTRANAAHRDSGSAAPAQAE
jgi:Putative adhesin